MKTIFTFLLVTIISVSTYAQDKIYVHTATTANISGHITFIEHPDLNNNPAANIVYKHVWNPNGNSGVLNNNIDGLWYANGTGRWAIYNEDFSPMVEGAQFFIYIAQNSSDVITHVASVANEFPGFPYVTIIDDPDFNNSDPGPYAVMSNYFNPNGVYNPHNYSFLYDSSTVNKRVIFSEDLDDIPTDAAFRILKSGTGVIDRFTAESTAANILGNWFTIDDASLNGNPNATFVFQHYWGVNGPSSEVIIDKVLSAWYDGANWAIYTEDSSPMPEGVAVDIIVAEQEILGVNENELTTNISIFPNPANAFLNIASNAKITEVSIYNMLGQEILHLNNDQIDKNTIDVSNLTAGNYLLKVQSNKSVQTLKFIKN